MLLSVADSSHGIPEGVMQSVYTGGVFTMKEQDT